MKNLIALAALLAATSLSAAITQGTLQTYSKKSFPQCPKSTFEIEQLPQAGPAGFDTYRVTQKSSDEYCGAQHFLLVSPRTEQTFLGTVIKLPDDPRPVHIRIAEHAGELLKSPIDARIAPFALPDGLKAVTLTRTTPFGPFSYAGFVDASEKFLLIGLRGSLNEDPGKTLLDAIGVSNAVRRGNSKAKAEIVELSDFECPTCGHAHLKVEPLISKNLSKINYARLDLPLFETHEWSFQAAMGARAMSRLAPAKYWQYVDDVFHNQQVLNKDTIDTWIKNWFTDHDVDWTAASKIYSSASERQALLEQVSRVFGAGIASTPTYIVNGQVMGFGPDGEYTINAIRKAIGLPPLKSTAKPKAAGPKK